MVGQKQRSRENMQSRRGELGHPRSPGGGSEKSDLRRKLFGKDTARRPRCRAPGQGPGQPRGTREIQVDATLGQSPWADWASLTPARIRK